MGPEPKTRSIEVTGKTSYALNHSGRRVPRIVVVFYFDAGKAIGSLSGGHKQSRVEN